MTGQLSIFISSLIVGFFVNSFLRFHSDISIYNSLSDILAISSPSFAFASAMLTLFSSYLMYVRSAHTTSQHQPMNRDKILINRYIFYMIIQSFAYFLLTALIDRFGENVVQYARKVSSIARLFTNILRARGHVAFDGESLISAGFEYNTGLKEIANAKELSIHGRGSERLIRDVNLVVREGERIALLGPNGGGKSTLFKHLALLEQNHAEGELRIQGKLSTTQRWSILQSQAIAYVPQIGGLLEFLSVRQSLQLFAKIKGVSITESHLIDAHYHSYRVNTLSGGNKKKLALEIALFGSFPLILLDEVTSGIDPISAKFIVAALKNLRNTTSLLFSSHRSDECLSTCNRVLIIKEGSLVYDGGASSFEENCQKFLQIDAFVIQESDVTFIINTLQNAANGRAAMHRIRYYLSHVLRVIVVKEKVNFPLLWQALRGTFLSLCGSYPFLLLTLSLGLQSGKFIHNFKLTYVDIEELVGSLFSS